MKSMTGYGRSVMQVNGREILVEIKSVNHRYYEFSAKLPRGYGYLEEKLKSFLNCGAARGKVEVAVSFYNAESTTQMPEVNLEIAKNYVDVLKKANETLKLEDDLSIMRVINFPDVLSVKKRTENEEDVWNDVKNVAGQALEKFLQMRDVEGQKIREDFLSRLIFIEQSVAFIEEKSPELTQRYKERLFNKLKDILEDKNIEEQRILFEASVYSEKTAVEEETVRLKSHISQFRDLINLDEPIGRKLDFLVQEINREINTIGSKIQDTQVTKTVLDLKSEVEKLREQLQNVE